MVCRFIRPDEADLNKVHMKHKTWFITEREMKIRCFREREPCLGLRPPKHMWASYRTC